MFNFVLRTSITYRYLVLCLSVVLAAVGAFSYQRLIIDAVPDITNIQVQINTAAPGYSPFEVEQRITAPIELYLSGLPALEYTRSISRYGLSQVTVIFKDKTDIHFARQLVAQRLQESKEKLPTDANPTMGPITTGLGEIFMFTVQNEDGVTQPKSLQELREAQDWVVKPQLRTVPGVVDVNSIGGAEKQIIVSPDLLKLRSLALTFDDLANCIARNNMNVGGGFIEQGGEQLVIRVPAQVSDFTAINDFVVATHAGTPILVRDVANVSIGSALRTGAATENGKEVVLGTVFMMIGENGREVAERVSAKLVEIKRSLPKGVTVKPVYNRANLVNATVATVRNNLIEGALLVIAILLLALGNIRAAIITALVIPLAMLGTIFGMVQSQMSANLMSLGALDFGLIVDGAVILVENCIRRLGIAQTELGRRLTKQERLDVVYEASIEVRQATMFGELIIMIVYIPILALTGIEGKMYHPMGITVLLALGSAFVLSLTFVPAAVAIFVTGKVKAHYGWIGYLESGYRWLLTKLLRIPIALVTAVVVFFFSSLALLNKMGSEFMPSLDEGDIALHALRIPGTSLTQAIGMQHQLETVIQSVPEVSHVFAKIGTAEIASDPMPPSVADGFIILKPRKEWSNLQKPKRDVVAELEELVTNVPGNNYEFTQPIQMRFNELIAGVRSDLAVKVFGDDTEVLFAEAGKIEKIIAGIQGAVDVKVEQVTGLPTIVITPDRTKIALLGIDPATIQDVVQIAYAGKEVSSFYQGDRKFPIVVRMSSVDRQTVEGLADLPVLLPSTDQAAEVGALDTTRTELKVETGTKPYINLGDIAAITLVEGPNQISRENGKRRVVVTANVRDRDLGSFVAEAEKKIAEQLALPANYWLGWGGQYQNLISAKITLVIVVPSVLLAVFALIFVTFRSLTYSLLVFTGVPFALSGGLIALWFRDIPFSISAAVGFIALSGVSVLNSLVLVSFTKNLLESAVDSTTAILDGASFRLRPVLMTALVASLGFLPMAYSHGTGSEVQRPLATVVIGGIVSSTALTLLILPVLLSVLTRRLRSRP